MKWLRKLPAETEINTPERAKKHVPRENRRYIAKGVSFSNNFTLDTAIATIESTARKKQSAAAQKRRSGTNIFIPFTKVG
jgi:hypothetical protein